MQALAAKSAHELDMTVHVDGDVPEGTIDAAALVVTDTGEEMVRGGSATTALDPCASALYSNHCILFKPLHSIHTILTKRLHVCSQAAHPLSVRLQLMRAGAPLLGVVFRYLPTMRLVTAAPTDPAQLSVLSALYPGDQGLQCPNPAHADAQWDADRVDRPYRCVVSADSVV